MFQNNIFNDSWQLVYEGEDTAGGGGTKDKTFTQEELNGIIAKEKETFEKKFKTLQEDVKKLTNSKTLTEKERDEIKKRLEEMETQNLSVEEKAKLEQERIKTEYETKLKQTSEEKSTWQSRYTDSTIINEITQASIVGEAHSPSQIIAILKPDTRLVEDIDPETKQPNGKFVPRVKFRTTDKDGKELELDVTVSEAVKLMKENPRAYGNLFKTNGVPGIGERNVAGQKGEIDYAKLSPEKYRELRKAGQLPFAGNKK